MTIFFTADTHFNHVNRRGSGIIQYCNRPFSNINEMNGALIENWNSLVQPSDTVYHLGDFGMGDCSHIFKKLHGQKFLLKGSHDKDAVRLNWAWVKCCYGLNVADEYIWLSHRAHRVWERSFHGSWHLFGHTHGRLEPYGRSFDIGVDCWEFRPVSFEEIQEKMKTLPKLDV